MKAKFKFVGISDDAVLWHGCYDPRLHLVLGAVYEVEKIVPYGWYTHFQLVDFPGVDFPSLAFEPQIED